MLFAHDTTAALTLAADLVNTVRDGDALTGVAALDAFLDERHITPRCPATPSDVAAVQALRPRLRAVWQACGPEELAGVVNGLAATLARGPASSSMATAGAGTCTSPGPPPRSRTGSAPRPVSRSPTWSGWARPAGCGSATPPAATRS